MAIRVVVLDLVEHLYKRLSQERLCNFEIITLFVENWLTEYNGYWNMLAAKISFDAFSPNPLTSPNNGRDNRDTSAHCKSHRT
jgi:hypothetical protein